MTVLDGRKSSLVSNHPDATMQDPKVIKGHNFSQKFK